MSSAICWAVCGPPDHGVVEVAARIARAAGGGVIEPDPAALAGLADRVEGRVLHLHVTDWLFGGAAAAARVGELADRLTARGVALTLTLHDLPQPSDGADLFARRSGTYRELVERAAGVVVSSEHERLLLAEIGLDVGDVVVVPLALDPFPAAAADFVDEELTVGVFGYLYPGKGHEAVLEALLRRGSGTLVAIGRASDRHADLVTELTDTARHGGVGFRCTGYVAAADLPTELRRVRIPVAPHTHVSASGSINSWIAAGRRPLVPAGRYVQELADRLPGSVTVYPPGGLDAALDRATTHPETTWLAEDLVIGPTTVEVAECYRRWLTGLLG